MKLAARHLGITEFLVDGLTFQRYQEHTDTSTKVSGEVCVSDEPAIEMFGRLALEEAGFILTTPTGEVVHVKITLAQYLRPLEKMTFWLSGQLVCG